MAGILIVDDDEMFCEPFSAYIRKLGHTCKTAHTFRDGLRRAAENEYDIVFLDVVLPDISGLEGIERLKQSPGQPEIIVITGEGSVQGAEIALQNGAWDYLEKPPAYSKIKLLVNRSLEYREKKHQFRKQKILNREFIIGNDAKLSECLEVVARASCTDGNVLISGETGTGKELMARAVHINSARSAKPFIHLDCTNIPVSLAENLLFGHERGAFTGADKDREGLIKQADGGTLFLDEVGDLPLPVQKSLLHVLQNRQYRPLGARKEIPADFRLISATNQDIQEMVAEGKFRRDLYFRLHAFHIRLPPLKSRTEDIRLLVNHYMDKICDEFGIALKGVSADLMEGLIHYEWPGNVRELINVVHASIANAVNEPLLYPHHLPVDIRIHFHRKGIKGKGENSKPLVSLDISSHEFPKLREFRKITESKYLDDLLQIAEGDAGKACKIAGVSRSGLYLLLEKHGKKMKE